MNLLSTVKELIQTSSPILKTLARHPRKLSLFIEPTHPKWTRQILSYASDLSEPFWLGMGIKIKDVSDQGVTVTLPFRWYNRLWRGGFHSGAVVSLAEFGLRLFWERHLDTDGSNLVIKGLTYYKSVDGCGDISACVEMSQQHIDQVIFQVQSEGEINSSLEVALYSVDRQRVGSVRFDYHLKMSKALADHFV